jgi:hypothetical protein
LSRERSIDLLAWSAAILMISSMLLILVGRIHFLMGRFQEGA